MAVSIGSVTLFIRANMDKLQGDLRKSVSNTRRQLNRLAKVAAVAMVAMAGAISASVMRAAKSVDELAKRARSLGVAVGELQAMRLAAELNGASIQELDKAVGELNKRLIDAKNGLQQPRRALQALGLTAEELIAIGPDQAFKRVADAISEIEDPMLRANAAQNLFGRGASNLLPMLMQGSEAIEEQARFLREMGIELNDVDTSNIELMNDTFTKLKTFVKGAAQVFAAELAPVITTVSIQLLNAVKQMGDLRDNTRLAVDIIATGFIVAKKVVHGWTLILKTAEAAMLKWLQTLLRLGKFAPPQMRPVVVAMELAGLTAKMFGERLAEVQIELDNLITKDISGDFSNGLEEARERAAALNEGLQKLARETAKEMEKKMTGSIGAIEDALTNLVTKGKLNFKSLVDTIFAEIVRLHAIRPLMATLFGGNRIGNFLGIEPRASGGPVSANRPFIVGEEGPELFVPNRTGVIIPNDMTNRMTGGSRRSGGDQITQINNFELMANAQIEAMIAQAAPIIAEQAVNLIADRRRRGF